MSQNRSRIDVRKLPKISVVSDRFFDAPGTSQGRQNVDFVLKKSIDRDGQLFQKKLTFGPEK